MADRRLDKGEVILFKKGLNVAVTSTSLAVDDLITEKEMACKNINEKYTADRLRGEVAKVVTKHRSRRIRQNISLVERKALQNLRKDRTIKIRPPDKRRATVIMNSTDYDNKIASILADVTIYEKLKMYPTRVDKNYKSKLVKTMKEWKRSTTISYYKIYPTPEAVRTFYGSEYTCKT